MDAEIMLSVTSVPPRQTRTYSVIAVGVVSVWQQHG